MTEVALVIAAAASALVPLLVMFGVLKEPDATAVNDLLTGASAMSVMVLLAAFAWQRVIAMISDKAGEPGWLAPVLKIVAILEIAPFLKVIAVVVAFVALFIGIRAIADSAGTLFNEQFIADADLASRLALVLGVAALAAAVAPPSTRDAFRSGASASRPVLAQLAAAVLVATVAMVIFWSFWVRPVEGQRTTLTAESVAVVLVGVVAGLAAFVYLRVGRRPAAQVGQQADPHPAVGVQSVVVGSSLLGMPAYRGTPRARTSRFFGAWSAGLLSTIGLVPGLVTVGTLGMMFIGPHADTPLTDPLSRDAAVFVIVVGATLGAVGWLALGLAATRFAGANQANPGMYQALSARAAALVTTCECPPADQATGNPDPCDCKDAKAFVAASQLWVARHLGTLRTAGGAAVAPPATGIPWTTGSGYVGLWEHIHRAEEAQLLYVNKSQVLAAAFFDRSRLEGSNIKNRDSLLTRSASAIAGLEPKVSKIVGVDPPAEQMDVGNARAIIRSVRQAINEFKDDKSAELVRLRKRVTESLLWTGMVGYLILALILLVDIPTGVVVTGAALYIVAALAGLLQRIYDELRVTSGAEDFGLSTARLIMAPLVSGLAGIGGVGLVALLSEPPFNLNIVGVEGSNLATAFDLVKNPFALVAAAVFGLAPGALISRVKDIAEKLKTDVGSTAPGSSDSPGG